jgi:hypothetical protein
MLSKTGRTGVNIELKALASVPPSGTGGHLLQLRQCRFAGTLDFFKR